MLRLIAAIAALAPALALAQPSDRYGPERRGPDCRIERCERDRPPPPYACGRACAPVDADEARLQAYYRDYYPAARYGYTYGSAHGHGYGYSRAYPGIAYEPLDRRGR